MWPSAPSSGRGSFQALAESEARTFGEHAWAWRGRPCGGGDVQEVPRMSGRARPRGPGNPLRRERPRRKHRASSVYPGLERPFTGGHPVRAPARPCATLRLTSCGDAPNLQASLAGWHALWLPNAVAPTDLDFASRGARAGAPCEATLLRMGNMSLHETRGRTTVLPKMPRWLRG